MLNLNKLLSRIFPEKRFLSNVLLLVGSSAFSQGLGIALAPLLTRLYSPSDFGVFAIYVSLLSLLLTVGSLRFEFALPLEEDDEDAAKILQICLIALLLTTMLSSLALFIFGETLFVRLGANSMWKFSWILPLGLASAGFFQILNYWMIRKKSFSALAKAKMKQSAALNGSQIILGLLHITPAGLIIGDVLGRSTGSIGLSALVYRENRQVFRPRSAHSLLKTVRRYVKFPLFSSISSLLNSAGHQLPPLFLAGIYGPFVAGSFAFSQKIIGGLFTVLGGAVAQVYLSEASTLARTDRAALNRLFWKTALRLLLAGSLVIALIAVLGPTAFGFFFGSNWVVAGEYLQILAPMLLAQFVVSPLSQNAIIMERQGLQLWGDTVRASLVLGCFWAAIVFNLQPTTTLTLYTACMVVSYAGFFALYKKVIS